MFFDKITDIESIAHKVPCSIFVVPPTTKLKLKNPLYLHPDDSKTTTVITVEQIRNFLALTNNRESSERFFIISPADAMNEAAQNAFLKTFEEPKPHCHFILLTEQPSLLLPTILSRAQLFYLKQTNQIDQPPIAKEKVMLAAKKLISATPRNLPALALELTKAKTQPRQQILEITATAIELLYKSYFKTHNDKFLHKLPHFIALYDHLSKNAHIKLHIVADLC